MKKKVFDPIVTQSILQTTLDEGIEKFGRQVDEKARQYRDDVLNKMDEMMGELQQIREDQLFIDRDLKDQDKRITKVEGIVLK